MAKLRKVGDVVYANGDIRIPFNPPVFVPDGTPGKIVKVGPDARYGWYVVEYPTVTTLQEENVHFKSVLITMPSKV